jgi:hypothetical protein
MLAAAGDHPLLHRSNPDLHTSIPCQPQEPLCRRTAMSWPPRRMKLGSQAGAEQVDQKRPAIVTPTPPRNLSPLTRLTRSPTTCVEMTPQQISIPKVDVWTSPQKQPGALRLAARTVRRQICQPPTVARGLICSKPRLCRGVSPARPMWYPQEPPCRPRTAKRSRLQSMAGREAAGQGRERFGRADRS